MERPTPTTRQVSSGGPPPQVLRDPGQPLATLANRYYDMPAVPRPRLLPLSVGFDKLPQNLGGERYALGVRGRDLRPLVVDFAADPLLGVYGDDRHGKSTLITNLVRNVVANRDNPDEVMVMLFDKSRQLSSFVTRHLVEENPLDVTAPADYYETDFATMAERIAVLAHKLDSRTPPSNLTWQQKRNWKFEGPLIYLIVDDLDAIPAQLMVHDQVTAGDPPGGGVGRPGGGVEPLLRHLANARDIGLRVIMTHRASGVGTLEVLPSSIPGQFATQNAQRILLSARTTTDKVSGVKFEDGLPPGRGFVIAPTDDNGGYVQLAAPFLVSEQE